MQNWLEILHIFRPIMIFPQKNNFGLSLIDFCTVIIHTHHQAIMIKTELIKCQPQEINKSALQIPHTTTASLAASGGLFYVALTRPQTRTIATVNNGLRKD